MADRVQVGLTEDADEKLTILRTETPYFGEDADVYRCAVAVALALDADISESLKKQQYATKYRVVRDIGGEDGPSARLDTQDGMLAGLIKAHRPEHAEEPYRYSQYLAVIGINYLYDSLVGNGISLHEALEAIQVRDHDAE